MNGSEYADVRYLTPAPGRRILAISDVHGNLEYLQGLLQKTGFCEKDILFLVGDMIEKGPESLAVLRYVMELEQRYTVYPVCGNCESLWQEERLLAADKREQLRDYLLKRRSSIFNEMLETVAPPVDENTDMDEAVRLVRKHFARELNWLEKLPNLYVTEHFIFVHAGVQPEVPFERQQRYRVMDMKAFYEQQVSFADRYCVVGHWPVVLYSREGQDASPIIDRERRIICIDGGNVLKRDGQLNCLIIPEESSSEFSWEYYDDYPQAKVLQEQKAGQDSHNITWLENEVELLRQEGDCAYVRQKSSGCQMWVPAEYLYTERGSLRVEDSTDAVLELARGEIVSLVCRTDRGMLVKKGGASGWYYGALEELEAEARHLPGFWREKKKEEIRMNAALENILTRNSVRSFETRPVEKDVLEQIMQAAVSAPTAMNRQTFEFVVIENPQIIAELAQEVGKAVGNDAYNFYKPAALVLAANDRASRHGEADCTCAMENILLAAHALGLGAVWIDQLRNNSDVPGIRALLTRFGLPEHYIVWGTVAMGYPAAPGTPKERTAKVHYVR